MKARVIVSGILIMLLPSITFAQAKNKRTHKKNIHTATKEEAAPVKTFKTPEWAPQGYKAGQHVYFPDHQTFYDPQRGYVTLDKNTWVTSPSTPLFLKNADLKKTRIQVLEDLTIDRHPETSYPRYMKMYPAEPGSREILVPVPKPAGQAGTP